MNTGGYLTDKASSEAVAYAEKKRQQLARAAQLKEERKHGGNLKNAASDMLSVQKDNRSQYNQVGADVNNSILSSPTVPSTYNGGSNFNATGNARDHGIGR